ncbi:MAG: glycosyltransferase [Niabella sp.]|nr:glycosyltransferase [Niabella sp.]
MSGDPQIFQTESRTRWNTFKWISRLLVFLAIAMIPLAIFSISRVDNLLLPGLAKADTNRAIHQTIPKSLSEKDKKKYKGMQAFISARAQNNAYIAQEKKRPKSAGIRAAFFVDWDPQSLSSLKSNVDKLDMVLPEWFLLDPDADTLRPNIDNDALQIMRKAKVSIIPMLSNVQNGDFDGKLLHRILSNPQKRNRLLQDIIRTIDKYKLHGINLDFEELKEGTLPYLRQFQEALYKELHSRGLLVTQDILPNDDNYNIAEISGLNDYIFLMAYDQFYDTSIPGPVSEQRWIEKVLDDAAKNVPSQKIVLCMATYGYDWPEKRAAQNLTYAQAISAAKEHNATIAFDNNTYNCHFSYTDYSNVKHQVWFNDAASNFNTMRFADDYGVAGVAIWRLGAEDQRLWTFYKRNLTTEAMKSQARLFQRLENIPVSFEKPDYVGDGEVLDVISEPQNGRMKITADTLNDYLIQEEQYIELPTKYVIRRFGQVVPGKQVLLTFDDGPDPEYTPQILRILKREQVPAAFFVVGINIQNHLPVFEQVYKEGFEIGNHTFTHPNIASVGIRRAQTEIDATRLLIEAVTGRSTILFRPPFNADAEPTLQVELQPVALSKKLKYYAVGESIDPEDWDLDSAHVNADSIYNRIVRQYEAMPYKDRGIILLHDAGGNRQGTVDALPRIIKYFKDRNIQFITVAQLLNLTRDQVMPPVKNDMLQADSFATKLVFGVSQFLTTAFWLAIFLGLGRVIFMGILAVLNYRRQKKETLPPLGSFKEKVSIIVPAYNEEVNCVRTVDSLLKQDYPNLEIIFVDDGSKDNTFKNISEAFAGHPKVKVLTKPNGGKASALNYGIAQASADYLVCIDADTQLRKDAISQLMRYFVNETIGAVAGNVKVGNINNVLTRWQSIEYITAQNFDRRAFDYINGITVVPGAIGAFRKKAIVEAGGFTTDSLAEDCDLTIRILRQGYVIRNCNDAVAITEAPETIRQFLKQRFRWSYGVMQSFWKNRDACFKARYKGLGMVSLPNILLFQIILPIIAPIADLLFFFSIYYNWPNAQHTSWTDLNRILFYYGIFLVVDVLVAAFAFSIEKEKNYWQLLWLIPQRFVYRQIMYIVLFRSLRRAIKGEGQGWGNLKRTGNVILKEP